MFRFRISTRRIYKNCFDKNLHELVVATRIRSEHNPIDDNGKLLVISSDITL